MIPIAKHFDPVLGIDIHILTIPPVGPVPIPHPHIGIVFDPIDYVPIMGSTVMVNGIPRATAGTSGKPVPHIPLGGPFAMPPGNEDELFMGSTTVLADGSPLSFAALPILSCQSVGMIAPIRMKKPKKTYGMTLPTTVVMPIPAGLPVLVGGPPTIDMMSMAMSLGLAGLGKAFKKFKKSKIGKKLGKKFKKAKQKAFKNMKPGFIKCKVLKAEPVNAITGEVVVEQEDFNIDGRIPFEWGRYYGSQNDYRGVCGNGWETPADMRLEIDSEGQALFYEGGPGARVFPHLPEDAANVNNNLNGDVAVNPERFSVTELVDGAVLTLNKGRFTVRTREGRNYQFQQSQNSFAKRRPQATTLLIEKIVDDYNNHLLFVRDQYDQLLRVEESAGRALIATSKEGLLRKLEFYHPEDKQLRPLVRYEYDTLGNLLTVYDALDVPYHFDYERGLLARHTDRNGLSFYYDYDQYTSEGKCIHSWGDGGLYDYHFEYQPQITTFINSLGHKSWIEFDENNLPLKEVDELGLVEAYEYDEAGRTKAVIDGKGSRTEYHYDKSGNLLQLVRADGSAIITEYDGEGNPAKVKDPNGNIWKQAWVGANKVSRQITPKGTITEYGYDKYGCLNRITNARNATSILNYNSYGHVTEFYDALGNITKYKNDVFGNVVEVTTSTGRCTQYLYDKKSRIVRIINPSGTIIDCEYDGEGNLTHYRDEAGNETRLKYGGLGEVIGRIQPDGTRVAYERDTEEQLIGVINERGQHHKFVRDARGRIVHEIDYWGNKSQYSYDEANNIVRFLDACGRKIEFENDSFGRMSKRTFSEGDEETFSYDGNGNLVAFKNKKSSCERVYDEENRLTEEHQGGFSIKNEYDEIGNRVRMLSSAGNAISYSYDLANRICGISINNKISVSIKKDADGFTVSEVIGDNLFRSYEYNSERFVTRQTVATKNVTIADRKYAYDHVGNVLEKSDFRKGKSYFTYDPMGRIISAIDPKSRVEEFLYDPSGDLIRSDHLENPETGLRKAVYQGADYFYDAVGNLARKRGKNCDLELRWDGKNQLIESRVSNQKSTTYFYDALGRRTEKNTSDDSIYFYWDGNHLLSEAVQGAGSTEYVYYPDTFEPLALISSDGETYFYLNDSNGAPLELCTHAGEVVWSAEYNILGYAHEAVGNKVNNSLRLQGQYFDSETGLHYNRFRYFDSHIGAFITRDPLGLIAGENPYQYAPNTLGWVDPLGLSCEKVDLQKAVDDIHIAEFGRGKGKGFPMTVTQLTDGTVIVSKVGGKPGLKAQAKAREIFGDNVKFAGGGKSGNLAGKSGQHAEQRGIASALNEGKDVQGAKQASTHYACPDCTSTQSAYGVENVTGTSAEHGGKITRPIGGT